LLSEARNAGAVADMRDWILPAGASEAYITNKGRMLADKLAQARASAAQPAARSEPGSGPPPPARRVTVRSVLGQQLANLVEMAAAGGLEFDDCKLDLSRATEEEVQRAIVRLQERIEAKEAEDDARISEVDAPAALV